MHYFGKGGEMSILKDVVDGDRKDIAWLVTEDSDGCRSRYVKGNRASPGVIPDLGVGPDRTVEIMKDADGKPHLRQDEPGLRKRIIVAFASRTRAAGFDLPVAAAWCGYDAYEYDQQAG